MFIYVAIIPIVEELATVIVQGLEVIKGKFVLKVAELQEKVEKPEKTKTRVIGFSLQDDEEEDEEEYVEDD